MAYTPAICRRTGYQFAPLAERCSPGLSGLTPPQERLLISFVLGQPPRVVAEALLEIAARRLDVDRMLALIQEWQRVPAEQVQTAGGHRMPPRALREVPR